MRILQHISKQITSHEQEIHTNPRPQLLMETGNWDYKVKATGCTTNGHPNIQGWGAAENREYNPKSDIGEEIIHYYGKIEICSDRNSKRLCIFAAENNKHYKMDENMKKLPMKLQEMRDTVMSIMTELGCLCEVNDEGDIDINFHDSGLYPNDVEDYLNDWDFYISFDDQLLYIEINELWKKVSLDDTNGIDRMLCAINSANLSNTATTAYYINEEEQAMVVSCSTNMPYLPQEEYLKKFLPQKVIDIFCINKLLEHELEEE